MKEYQHQESLPEGFREKLSTKVITMASEVKKKQTKEASVKSTELIFSRVLYLAANGSIDFSTLFNYELAPDVSI